MWGGSRNPLLTSLVAPGDTLRSTWRVCDDFGISADALEAVIFAVLAHETVCGRCRQCPVGDRSAQRAVILGKVVPGSRWMELVPRSVDREPDARPGLEFGETAEFVLPATAAGARVIAADLRELASSAVGVFARSSYCHCVRGNPPLRPGHPASSAVVQKVSLSRSNSRLTPMKTTASENNTRCRSVP